jgi:hypothetical protein
LPNGVPPQVRQDLPVIPLLTFTNLRYLAYVKANLLNQSSPCKV